MRRGYEFPRRTPWATISRPVRGCAADRRIDQLVYELYGLTDEEIRIVEAATS